MTTSNKALALRHEMLILDANLVYRLDPKKYVKTTTNVVNALLRALKMSTLGDLQIFKAVDLNAPGWSFIQPITTSHISGHYFERPGKFPHLHLDIYSCKRFNCTKVIRILNDHLHLAKWSANFVIRNTRHSSRIINGFEGYGSSINTRFTWNPKPKH